MYNNINGFGVAENLYPFGWPIGRENDSPGYAFSTNNIFGPDPNISFTNNIDPYETEEQSCCSYSIRENKNIGGNMSILITEIIDDKIIMMSDSRSSQITNNQFPRMSVRDDYQKIVYIKESNILIGSVGLNSFKEFDLCSLVEHVYLQIKETTSIPDLKSVFFIKQFIATLNAELQYYSTITNIPTTIVYGYYDSKETTITKRDVPLINIYDIKSDGIQNKTSTTQGIITSMGEIFAQEFFKRIYLPEVPDAFLHYKKLKSSLEDLVLLESTHFANSSVGGKIQEYMIDNNGIISF